MSKNITCFNCDAEYKIKQPEGNEDTFGLPSFCPFCGVDLESEDTVDYEEESEEDE